MIKKIIQFGFEKVGAASKAFSPLVDCRSILNPFNRLYSDEVIRARVKLYPGFDEKVAEGVALLTSHDTIYVGCSYGKHRSWAVSEAIAEKTGAEVIHMHEV